MKRKIENCYSDRMPKKASATKPRRAAAPKAAPKPKLEVTIDYPQADEAVRAGRYSIRITASGAGQAQLRVDGGDWLDCRESVGHFWHDWEPRPGEFSLAARARVGKGRWAVSAERPCRVA